MYLNKEELFPNEEAYRNVSKGFMFMEMAHKEWLTKYFLKYGPDVAFTLDPDDDTLADIILSTGNIRVFLADLVSDSQLIEAIKPEHYRKMGMLDQWQDHFEIYAAVWAKMIKVYLIQGFNVMEKSATSGGLNSAVDVDLFDHDYDRFESSGKHQIDTQKLIEQLGPEGLAALHVYFHAVDLSTFHKFLSTPPPKETGGPFDSIVTLTRMVGQYVEPKNLLPEHNEPKSDKIDSQTFKEMGLDKLFLN